MPKVRHLLRYFMKGGCLKSCSEHEDDVAITSPHSGQILIPDVKLLRTYY